MHRELNRLPLTLISRMLTPKGVIASATLLWASVIALCGWIAYQSYLEAIKLAEQNAHNLLVAIERDLDRTVKS